MPPHNKRQRTLTKPRRGGDAPRWLSFHTRLFRTAASELSRKFRTHLNTKLPTTKYSRCKIAPPPLHVFPSGLVASTVSKEGSNHWASARGPHQHTNCPITPHQYILDMPGVTRMHLFPGGVSSEFDYF